MGTVYLAEHRLMDRSVALKVIRRDLLGNETLVERFRREVRAAARLALHPNIVAAYDAEQAGDPISWSWNSSRESIWLNL